MRRQVGAVVSKRGGLTLLACLVWLLVACSGTTPQEVNPGQGTGSTPAEGVRAGDPVAEQSPGAGGIPAAVLACSACHTLPPPDILPRSRWPHLITRMKLLIEEYQIGDPLKPLQLDTIVRYYVTHSPQRLEDVIPAFAPPTVRFAGEVFGDPAPAEASEAEPPIIGHLSIEDLDGDGRPDVLASDIRNHTLSWLRQRKDGRWGETVLARVKAPARMEVDDIDGDDRLDIVVASLGQMDPTDELLGSVVLLHGRGKQTFEPRTLLDKVARVPDVRPVDLDGDGDKDILFAAYGMYKTGHIGWLEQRDDGEWLHRTLYTRNGISHVPVADVNEDGRPDFFALLSQQHEEVMLFINQGDGRFDSRLLFKAPHPMFGSSNILLVDLDRDGDTDVLFTAGDALDTEPYAKPWHGLYWLENRGALEFAHHEVLRFHGAYAAACGDLDGDQDLDIVVTSMMNRWDDPNRAAIIWLENDGSQKFTPQALSNSPTFLVTTDVGDLDGDGLQDIIAGGMYLYPPHYRVGRISRWRNLGLP